MAEAAGLGVTPFEAHWTCRLRALAAAKRLFFLRDDYRPPQLSATAAHYTRQWQFTPVDAQKDALTSRRLPWAELIDRIRLEGGLVYDAGCGFGDLHAQLFREPSPNNVRYLGTDIHDRLPCDTRNSMFIRWDISEPPPVTECFDWVICRSALHHTPDPAGR
jgi:SAM-dependent methyltransferase